MDEEQKLAEYEMFKQNAIQDPNIMQQIQGMEASEAEMLLQNMFRDYNGETEILNEQAAQASAMRDTAAPEGRQFGNVYTAANPLEHLAAGVSKFQGQKQYDKAMAGKEAMSADKTGAQTQIGTMAGSTAMTQQQALAEAMRKQKQDNQMAAANGWN